MLVGTGKDEVDIKTNWVLTSYQVGCQICCLLKSFNLVWIRVMELRQNFNDNLWQKYEEAGEIMNFSSSLTAKDKVDLFICSFNCTFFTNFEELQIRFLNVDTYA